MWSSVELCSFGGYELEIHSMNYPLYADGTRARIGEERASFSQLQTPWTYLSHQLNWNKRRWMVFSPRGVFSPGVFIHYTLFPPSGCLSFSHTRWALITQDTVVKYRKGELNHLSEDEIWSAKHLYDSAYHPDTGGRQWQISQVYAVNHFEDTDEWDWDMSRFCVTI